MNAPPPLPASSATPAPARDATQGFVTVLAWITIALGALGLAYGLLQMLTSTVMTADTYQRLLDPMGTGQVALPPLLRWSMEHNLAIGLVQALGSALTLWLGWGLLRRREWARLGFIAYLVVGTVLTFGLIWLVPAVVEQTLSMQFGLQSPGLPLPPELAAMTTVATAFSAVIVVVFAGLHGGIIWKLCTAAVRAQFNAGA
jgi:hypothetical protein